MNPSLPILLVVMVFFTATEKKAEACRRELHRKFQGVERWEEGTR